LHFHANRSEFEDDFGPPRQFVFVIDHTDRDEAGALPPQNSIVELQFSLRWRATEQPSLVSSCENELQVHEGQFVYTELRGPATYEAIVEPRFHCAHESAAQPCEFQQVVLDAANFQLYIASQRMYIEQRARVHDDRHYDA
jgi:hypothetical protein